MKKIIIDFGFSRVEHAVPFSVARAVEVLLLNNYMPKDLEESEIIGDLLLDDDEQNAEFDDFEKK